MFRNHHGHGQDQGVEASSVSSPTSCITNNLLTFFSLKLLFAILVLGEGMEWKSGLFGQVERAELILGEGYTWPSGVHLLLLLFSILLKLVYGPLSALASN